MLMLKDNYGKVIGRFVYRKTSFPRACIQRKGKAFGPKFELQLEKCATTEVEMEVKLFHPVPLACCPDAWSGPNQIRRDLCNKAATPHERLEAFLIHNRKR